MTAAAVSTAGRTRITVGLRPLTVHGTVVPMPSSTRARELIELMRQVAAGDQAAFAAVYDATSRSVFGVALRVLTDHAQAEEVTQEVYIEAWRSAARYDPDQGSVSAWLTTFAHRKAVDRVRSVERSRQRERRHAEASAEPHAADTAETVVAHDDADRVRRAVRDLPEAQRTAIELAYYQGRTQREIAEFLEIPLGTAKTRIRDALKRLRRAMGEITHE